MPPGSRTPCCSGCEPPGVGAAFNSLPQLPGCPQLPKAQIRGAGGAGRRRSQEARPLHSLSSPSPARQRALLLGGALAARVGAGPRERPTRRHPPLQPNTRSQLAGVAQPYPHLPFLAFASVGASSHWRVPSGKEKNWEPGAERVSEVRIKSQGRQEAAATAQRGTARRDGREATGCSPASCTWLVRAGAPSFPAKHVKQSSCSLTKSGVSINDIVIFYALVFCLHCVNVVAIKFWLRTRSVCGSRT
ncbi:uncharacterized protein LOC117081279 [Trachypithecus francoisi]|uniref:uncharacterized protein LOC117081279 n=1 Tax=Trachypithecus francoisi TaxID=54180 RepID=UPI00141BE1F3|nr:uncharacterized protein LOC117081279 [Trachypithecus francoisi]